LVDKCDYFGKGCKDCKIGKIFTNDLISDRQQKAELGCLLAKQDLEQSESDEREYEDNFWRDPDYE
jgi:hypothetical protein